MEIRSNNYTPIFVLGFIIVLVAKHFFNPFEAMLNQYDILNNLGDDFRSDFIRLIIPIVIPPIASMGEIFAYIKMAGNGFFSSKYVAINLICLIYAILVYIIERVHSAMHNDESSFTICVNMLCMENILMYIFSILAYFLYQTITSFANIPDFICGIFLLTVGMFVIILMVVNGIYATIGAFIIMLPVALILDYGPEMSLLIEDIVSIVVMLFMSQVVWRRCSNVVFKTLLKYISFGIIDINW